MQYSFIKTINEAFNSQRLVVRFVVMLNDFSLQRRTSADFTASQVRQSGRYLQRSVYGERPHRVPFCTFAYW
jgi:uncharacterized protein YutD